jgi:hypothetical protein
VSGRIHKWLCQLLKEARGNAVWDFTKAIYLFAASLVLSLIPGIVAWLKQASWPIVLCTVAVVFVVVFLTLISVLKRWLAPSIQKLDSSVKEELSVVLSPVPGDIFKSRHYRIEIHNKGLISANNVKVAILRMHPIPHRFGNPQFPINLPAVGGDRTINPNAKGYFDFIEIVGEPKLRRVIFLDDVGHTQSFQETMSDMLRSATEREYAREYSNARGLPPSDDGYSLEIQVSALDRAAITRSIRLKLFATQEDELGLTPIGGVIISLA